MPPLLVTNDFTPTASGLNSASSGSLIYAHPSTPQTDYAIHVRYKLPGAGGSYVIYFRASTDANLVTNSGTFYAVEITNVTWVATICTASMHVKSGRGRAVPIANDRREL